MIDDTEVCLAVFSTVRSRPLRIICCCVLRIVGFCGLFVNFLSRSRSDSRVTQFMGCDDLLFQVVQIVARTLLLVVPPFRLAVFDLLRF